MTWSGAAIQAEASWFPVVFGDDATDHYPSLVGAPGHAVREAAPGKNGEQARDGV